MLINCFSISSNDQLNLVYILLNSLKHIKQTDTNIQYSLLLELTQQKNLSYCQNYFQPLSSDDFKITIMDISSLLPFMDKSLKPPHYAYIKCFAPRIFKNLDKILYLDTDMVFYQQGVEQLWNTDISRYYLAAVEQPIVTYFMKQELKNTHTKRYFNSGVMLLNLKKIRKFKLDDEMINMVVRWDYNKVKPKVVEQSFLNYLFKRKVKFIDFKFNNSILVATSLVVNPLKEYLKKQYNILDIRESLFKTVIFHFLGQNKPWKEEVKNYDTEVAFPYKKQCLNIWNALEREYKHP